MKKVLCVLLAAMTLLACNKESKQTTPSIEDFPYMVDQFYDLGILRYRVPGFVAFIALIGQMALSIAAVTRYFGVFNSFTMTLPGIAGKTTEEWKKFVLYLKRVWFSNGIHHHYSEDKFLPECSREWFVEACKQSNLKEEDYVELLDVMFDPTVLPKKVCTDSGVDLLMNSACNYYEGVTQAEAEAYYAAHKDDSAEPLWIGLNSKLVKDAEGNVVERVYRVEDGGLYSVALAKVVENLEKALPYAETEEQKVVIEKLISFNKTGDLRTFNEYAIAWVKDLQSRVDFVNGFTEVYGDPLGITGAWESLVNYKDLAATERTIKMSENAQWFEDNSPTDPKYKKAECKGVTAKVITAAILAGDCYPATPIGINLPNANWIRKSYGSKSVTIQNLMEAYNEAALGNGFNEEFMLSDKELDYSRRYSALTGDVQVDLHECLGHGSGQLMPGVTKDNLREHGSTLEEARADLFSLYYIADPKLVELGILPDNEAYKAEYYEQMMNGAMTQLVRVEPGKNLEEAHMRNRALIANWVLAHTNADKPEAEIIVRDGKHYLQINDYEGLRTLYGQLLAIVQEVVSTGDYAQARQLVEDYAVRVDPDLHQEMLARYKPLNIPPYKGFVNPVYTPVMDKEGNITDVTIDYSEGYIEQHLRYSRDYSELPDINR